MTNEAETDWSEWSREAVRRMQARNEAWISRYGLEGNPFHWDMDESTLILDRGEDEVVATICVIGSVSLSEGTFLWAWANETIPEAAKRGLDLVRAFGENHGLDQLTTPEWPGDRAAGLEMLAVAGRILDAEGVWILDLDDGYLFFTLSGFRTQPKGGRQP